MARLDINNRNRTLEKEKRETIKIARDLRYSDDVVTSIKNAQTSLELDRIMKSARSKAKND